MNKRLDAKKVICFLLPVFIMLGCFFFAFNTPVSADAGGLSHVSKVESVLVRKGDTLSSLAGYYGARYSHVSRGEYLDQIRQLNDMDSDYITAGSYLLVPDYR